MKKEAVLKKKYAEKMKKHEASEAVGKGEIDSPDTTGMKEPKDLTAKMNIGNVKDLGSLTKNIKDNVEMLRQKYKNSTLNTPFTLRK